MKTVHSNLCCRPAALPMVHVLPTELYQEHRHWQQHKLTKKGHKHCERGRHPTTLQRTKEFVRWRLHFLPRVIEQPL